MPCPLAIGVDLRLLSADEGGRSNAVGRAPYEPWSYRPNWQWGGIAHPVQATGLVVWLGKVPLEPGERTRAIVQPVHPDERAIWSAGGLGNEVQVIEGRVLGIATVEWMLDLPTEHSGGWDDEQLAPFRLWCSGGPRPG